MSTKKLQILNLPQSDWNQNDETAPDYVKNRTHYDNNIVIEWDGNTNGLTHVTYNDMDMYKVSDLTPPFEIFIGGKGTMTDNEITMELPIEDDDESYNGDSYWFFGEGVILCILEPCVIGDTTFNETGLYLPFIADSNVYISRFESVNNIVQLDDKFIPDTIARVKDINDIFWAIYGETTNAEILEAYNAGKTVVCKVNDHLIEQLYSKPTATRAAFSNAYSTVTNYATCQNDVWYKDTWNVQLMYYKDSSISNESTDDRYPSSKAVYDFVTENIETVNISKQDKITGTTGQFVVIGDDGNVTTENPYAYSQTDLEAGVSELETGKLYFVYE